MQHSCGLGLHHQHGFLQTLMRVPTPLIGESFRLLLWQERSLNSGISRIILSLTCHAGDDLAPGKLCRGVKKKSAGTGWQDSSVDADGGSISAESEVGKRNQDQKEQERANHRVAHTGGKALFTGCARAFLRNNEDQF